VPAVLASSARQANCRNLREKHISSRFSRARAARRGAQCRAIRTRDSPKKENAPRRWLPRPASRLTFAEASADRETINLRCSYLGATTTVDGPSSAVKSDLDRSCRKLRLLYLDPCGFADRARCSRKLPVRSSPGRCTFVHVAGRLSACAYCRPARLRSPVPRARRRVESMLRRGRGASPVHHAVAANCECLEKTWSLSPDARGLTGQAIDQNSGAWMG